MFALISAGFGQPGSWVTALKGVEGHQQTRWRVYQYRSSIALIADLDLDDGLSAVDQATTQLRGWPEPRRGDLSLRKSRDAEN
jgi:hypothetical protein